MSNAPPPTPIAYANTRDPGQPSNSPWPMIMLVVLSLGLIVLGGCFCIGLLLLTTPSLLTNQLSSPRLTEEQVMLEGVLVCMAIGCFVPGMYIVVSVMLRMLKRV